MSTLNNSTTKTILGEWEEVYSVLKVTENWGDEVVLYRRLTKEEIDSDVMYYQTFVGGPEGGFFVRGALVFRVSRGWFQPWKVELLKNAVLEYEPENQKAGQTARCRKIEVYSLAETRAIVDEHLLSGNAREIVKCLRDGLSPKADIEYKDLCLRIILDHFQQIDSHLDLLPSDTYTAMKKVLNDLAKEHKDDGERESESESESEDDLELQEAYREGKKDGYEEATAEKEEALFAESQWKAYMGEHTSWTLYEAYEIYVRPGAGGKKWTKAEAKVFEKIQELSQRGENPYVFRLMPTK